MELAGAALRQSLPTAVSPAVGRGRRIPVRVACARGGFADEGHLRYYDAGTKAVAKDLSRLRATGLVAGDASKEKVLAEATDLLLRELNKMKDEEYIMKKARKEEKAVMKALKQKQQQKEAEKAAAVMGCEDGSSSESSESDCEGRRVTNVEQGMVISTAASEFGASGVSTISATECDMAAMKAVKKMEKEQKKAAKKAMKKMEEEQMKAAKKAMKKMEKEAKKMALAALNVCRDEDSSSCSSESSESECEGEVVRMSRCATVIAPQQPTPSTVFPIIVPQIPESAPLQPSQEPRISSEPPASATRFTSIAVVEKPTANRIEVCMGGKCKKSGALALLQEFEKEVGVGGAVVGCKCLGKCGLGPNVRLGSVGSAKNNPLYIGVGLEDVGTIVSGLFGDGDLGMMTSA